MLVIALCTTCFSRAKINKKLWPTFFKIWPPYFECSGAGTGCRRPYFLVQILQIFRYLWCVRTDKRGGGL